jgi:Flp pilus assembly protein TadG
MRARRGNFLIIFLVSFTVLMGISSLAIDGTRVTTARSQMQATADASALAALAAFRETQNADDAEAAALEVAQSTFVGDTTGNIEMELDIGTWDFETDKVSAFDADPDRISSVRVTVRRDRTNGVSNTFGGGQRTGLGARATASFRARDLVVVLDATPSMGESDGFDTANTPINQAKLALRRLAEIMEDNGIPEDRLGLIMFTGGAQEILPLTMVEDYATGIRNVIDDLDYCGSDYEQWLNYWRFMELETREHNRWPLYAIDPWSPTTPASGWEDEDIARYADVVATNMASTPLDCVAQRAVGPAEFEACAWQLSFLMFSQTPFYHPGTTVTLPDGSDVDVPTCNQGNVWSAGPVDSALDYNGFANEVVVAGTTVLPSTVLNNTHAWAGTNPASGLEAALEMLRDNGNAQADPVVVLISDGKPSCETPTYDAAPNVASCDENYRVAAYEAADALEEFGAHTWIVNVNLEENTEQSIRMGELTTGRGRYIELNNSNQLTEFLTHVAKDVRIQLVK